MKFHVITDFECSSQVSQFEQVRASDSRPELKRESKALLTGEINAAIEGVLEAHPFDAR